MNRVSFRWLAAFVVALLVGSAAAVAQLQSGNLYGVVQDEQGSALPGVTVTLTGGGAAQVQMTDGQGRFRFLGLPPGSYGVEAELEGFSTVEYPNVAINVGRNTEIEIGLASAVEDVITVTAESPLLDSRRISTGATVNQTELEKIPTARDPWAILQSTPGVLMDRINVGGNESGQQSAYVGPGSGGDQAIWAVDGMVITDMAATGSTPAYFDFDSFEEMQITTGGSDATIATGGVVMNIVTKRGTNEWRGSGRYLTMDEDWQSDPDVAGDLGRDFDGGGPVGNQAPFRQGNRIVSVEDYGLELGGPILRDRLWVWGAYAKPQIDLRTAPGPGFPEGAKDFTELETANFKLNAQLGSTNSATLFALQSDKVKLGRNAGPTRPPETTWNQSKFGDDPTAYKVEDTHIFSSSFYLTGMYSVVNGGFQLVPQGGLTATSPAPYLDENQIWHNSYLGQQVERPQEQVKADASSFFNTGSLSHELKFGAGYRTAETTTLVDWSGPGLIQDHRLFGLPATMNAIALDRPAIASIEQTFTNVYVQDTLSTGNLTANIGLRYDLQKADNLPVSIPGNPLVPHILPSVEYDGSDETPEWEDVTPRLGLTYALGEERKTLLRASYSRFADQMGTPVGSWANPAGYALGYAYFYGSTTGPSLTAADLLSSYGYVSAFVDPRNGGLRRAFDIDDELEAPTTDELLFSVEHAVRPEFVVGLNLTWRRLTDLLEQELLVFDGGDPYCAACLDSVGRPHQRSDYERQTTTVTLPTGEVRTVEYYRLRPEVSTMGGLLLENGDREQEYLGASLTFNKRLANRWMLRGNFTWSDWEWSKVPLSEREDLSVTLGGGDSEGDPVLQGSGTASGAKGAVFINSSWAYNLNALYQVAPDRPWGFNVAAAFNGREGYAMPYFTRIGVPANYQPQPFRLFIAGTDSPDEFRFDDVHTIDLRAEKELTFGDFGATLGIDVFNVTNENTVLQRQLRLGIGTTDHLTEHLSPRIVRLGVRLNFR